MVLGFLITLMQLSQFQLSVICVSQIPQGQLHIAQVPQGEEVQITQDSEASACVCMCVRIYLRMRERKEKQSATPFLSHSSCYIEFLSKHMRSLQTECSCYSEVILEKEVVCWEEK